MSRRNTAATFVSVVLDRGSHCFAASELVQAFDAAVSLAASTEGREAGEWAHAVERIHTWLAVRCVCGDPDAVRFINDRRAPTTTRAA